MNKQLESFERWFAKIRNPWIGLVMIALILLCYFSVDRPLALYLHDLHLGIKFPVIRWISTLGSFGLYLILLPLLAILCRMLSRKQAEIRLWFLWFCLLVPGIVTFALKGMLGRARPELLFTKGLFGFYGVHMQSAYASFPSGHTTAMTSLIFGLSMLFPRYVYAIVTTGFGVMLTRILLTEHYLSDVLATAYLVSLEFALLFYILRDRRELGIVLK